MGLREDRLATAILEWVIVVSILTLIFVGYFQ